MIRIPTNRGHVTRALLILLLLSLSVPSLALSPKELKRTNEEGGVTITVLYMNPLKSVEKGVLGFEVSLNTHSVDLDQYRLAEISSLQIDDDPPRSSIAWFDAKGGGHHLSGILKFGGSFPETAQKMRLVIRGVGGVPERSFEWLRPLDK